MFAVTQLGKHYADQTLFEGVSVQFNAGERYGIVGANGCGKSTLLKIIAGDEQASEGDVSLPKRARIGVLRQDQFQHDDQRILDVVMMGRVELWEAFHEKEAILAKAETHFDADRYAELEDIILREDGYTLEARAGEILEGLGIPTASHHDPLSSLSGGFKLRVLLAQVLASDPDVLLLDEPTNHLDILSIRWLETFLESFKGVTLVVSHDRRFLNNICTHVADVDYQTLTLYKGNYDAAMQAKVEDRERREKEIAKRQKEIADHKAFVERFKAKATKARQAQSRVKRIAKMTIDTLAQSSRRSPHFSFKQRRPSGKQVLTIDGVSKAFGEKQVLSKVTLNVQRGDRAAIIGPNGIGKSTLLKIAMGLVEADVGKHEWGYEAHPGYFAQDHREQVEAGDQSVQAWLWDTCPSETMSYVRGRLGAVLFSRDEVLKPLSALSGGEAARLVFARQMVEGPNVLVLDEPTNHLDLESIEALVSALQKYDGTLLFVSHDRWFVNALATRIIEITPDGIQDFHGSYAEYLERAGDDHLDSASVLQKAKADKKKERGKNETAAQPSRVPQAIQPKQRSTNAAKRNGVERKVAKVTKSIESTESRLKEIHQRYCEPAFFNGGVSDDEAKKLKMEEAELQAKLDRLMGEWESLEA